ncbi:DNA-binding transcriptional regulator, LysR family [Celeribacter baekdonensis]|uniref:DNA-binding transcriptional regulator, LysR family n=1 Tax=Celeribacter baekdonensis TaxID=875171 RepID=A0A1G7R5J1_9RHOB|nr:LysR family transcriptional regulator [Celeribacter baekdonensis]SDG06066.1 DNA-binding transcriptional regulator, LysR family [Celeribacter baekdonensis]
MRSQTPYSTHINSIQDLTIFTTIVEAGSLSQAARDLNLSLALVSKRLSKLEDLLGVRLITRSTRSLSVTESGQDFYEQCRVILEGIQRAENSIQSRKDEISGSLTITSSTSFARLFLAKIVFGFQALHPNVSIHLLDDDGIVSLIDSGVDLAIRQAVLPSSSLIAVAIATDYRIVCASPGYLRNAPAIDHPKDISAHECVVFGSPPITDWRLSNGQNTVTIPVKWRISTRSGDATTAAAMADAGLAYSSIWSARAELDAGHIVNVLPDWRSPERKIYAVYPSRTYQTPLLKAFVHYLGVQAKGLEKAFLREPACPKPALLSATDCAARMPKPNHPLP